MKNKIQNQANATPVEWLEELKHSVPTAVAAHKNQADARIVFNGWPLRIRFPVAFIGHHRRKFPKAFCFILKLLSVCLRAGFQFDGRINDREEKYFVPKRKRVI
jgi:hypothetical protein